MAQNIQKFIASKSSMQSHVEPAYIFVSSAKAVQPVNYDSKSGGKGIS
jgi:hypothetical protein